MKTRQTFEDIRNRKKERLTLRVRMVIWVQVELLACVGLAFLIDNIAHTLNPNWNIPLLLELVIVSVVVGGVMTAVISKTFFLERSVLNSSITSEKSRSENKLN